MNKVRLICEASWMVDPSKINLDFGLIENIYTTCLSFLNTNEKLRFVAVAWGFDINPETYERFIKPWRKETRLSFQLSGGIFEEDAKKEQLDQAKNEVEEFALFTCNLNLHPSSLQVLKTEFLRWAIPQAMNIFEKLARLVQPDLYKEMLQILRPEAPRS